jgi:nicotinic acid mononucleotide adenylyltransferase
MYFICSCRNKNQPKAIYPKGTSHHALGVLESNWDPIRKKLVRRLLEEQDKVLRTRLCVFIHGAAAFAAFQIWRCTSRASSTLESMNFCCAPRPGSCTARWNMCEACAFRVIIKSEMFSTSCSSNAKRATAQSMLTTTPSGTLIPVAC